MLCDNTGLPYVEVNLDADGNLLEGLRQDGDWDIPIQLSLDVWGLLALEAHAQDITLNDYLTKLLLNAAESPETFMLTPDEWLAKSSHFRGLTVVDPDGWDRANFAVDWATPITLSEMQEKLNRSTCLQMKEKT